MTAVANIFDVNGDGFIDYYEFVSALHPSRDPYRRTIDADQINEEVLVASFNHCSNAFILNIEYISKTTNKSKRLAGESAGISVQLSKKISSRAD